MKQMSNNQSLTITNTSSNFLLKSEVVDIWNKFAKIDLINCFVDYEDKPFIATKLIKEIFTIVNDEIQQINEKFYSDILKALHLEKSKNFEIKKDLEKTIVPFIRENYNEIYFNKTSENDIITKITDKYKKFYFNFIHENSPDKNENDFEEIINSQDFSKMILRVMRINLFLTFHDPKLFLDLSDKKFNFSNFNLQELIFPFGKSAKVPEENICLILNSPVLVSNGFVFSKAFQPIAMIINNDKPKEEKEAESNKELESKLSNNKSIEERHPSSNTSSNQKNYLTTQSKTSSSIRSESNQRFLFDSNNISINTTESDGGDFIKNSISQYIEIDTHKKQIKSHIIKNTKNQIKMNLSRTDSNHIFLGHNKFTSLDSCRVDYEKSKKFKTTRMLKLKELTQLLIKGNVLVKIKKRSKGKNKSNETTNYNTMQTEEKPEKRKSTKNEPIEIVSRERRKRMVDYIKQSHSNTNVNAKPFKNHFENAYLMYRRGKV